MSLRVYKQDRIWYAQSSNMSHRCIYDCDLESDKPASAYQGEKCYVQESDKTYSWTGSSWVQLGGAQGPAGADGKTWHNGGGAPSDTTGVNGDFYLDTTADAYYGPKAAGSWTGTGPTSLIGPQGPAGSVTDAVNTIYPVGSIYLSTLSTNPATLLGVGTWAVFAAGRMLVGRDSGDVDFDTSEETGGAKTKTLATTEIPSHTHTQTLPGSQAGNFACGTRDASSGGTGGSPTTVNDTLSTQATGGGQAFSLMNPYIVVYMWKRTA